MYHNWYATWMRMSVLDIFYKTEQGDLAKVRVKKLRRACMKKKHIGSNFDDFLNEESILDHASAVAVKRLIAWQIEQEMAKQKLTKTVMAKKMRTSRAALNRLLDESDTSLTLITLISAASALGKMITFKLKAA
jgi:antitoxin HicB